MNDEKFAQHFSLGEHISCVPELEGRISMSDLVVSRPSFGFVVATRAALAFGIGLLVANRIPESRRRAVALALIGLGAATTIPAAKVVFGNS
jgi:hypothetical protein